MKSLVYFTEIRPYRFGLMVSIGQDHDSFKKSLKDADITRSDVSKAVSCSKENSDANGYVQVLGSDCIMRIRDYPKGLSEYGTIIHELLHVVRACLKDRGITMGGIGGQESYCYLLQDLFNDLVKRMDR